jgi:hypothetical protein
VFFVLTVYLIRKEDCAYVWSVACATGSILTSCVIAAVILLDSRQRFIDRLAGFFKSAAITVLFFMAFGRFGTIMNGVPQAQRMKLFLGALTKGEKCRSYLNMIGSSFVSITPEYQGDRIWWTGLTTTVNIPAVIVLLICAYIMIRDWRRSDIRASLLWIVFSFVLVYITGWSITESPLFAVYFSWAFMLPVGRGLERLAGRMKDRQIICYACIAAMAALNAGTTLPVVFAAMKM